MFCGNVVGYLINANASLRVGPALIRRFPSSTTISIVLDGRDVRLVAEKKDVGTRLARVPRVLVSLMDQD